MIKRYYSSYTGKQIDEAVRAIIENGITVDDFSDGLVAQIKQWIRDCREVICTNRSEFPEIGDPLLAYIAIDEQVIYFWSTDDNEYVALRNSFPDIINCGGARD